LGPAAGANQWTIALEKFSKRCRQVNELALPVSSSIRQFNFRAIPVLGYIAQLAPPPPNFTNRELTEVLRALKFSGCCISTDAAYNLEVWFGINPVRPRNYMLACMLRACHKTYVGYTNMHEELERKAFASQVLDASHSLLPWGWDADAFASNLFKCATGELPPPFSNIQPGILSILRDRTRKGSLQKAFHELLNKNSLCYWPKEVIHKIQLLIFPSPRAVLFSDDQFGALVESLNVCKRSVRTSYFKSLSNQWATRSRYQEHSHSCIFGCNDSKDNLKHYLQCECMWTLATSAIPLPIAFLGGTPEERLSLHSASVVRIRILAAAYRAYHVLVFQFKQRLEDARLSDDYLDVCVLFSQLVQIAWRHE
jgi:hypothetical protein